ncbi:hypothetical protein H4J58_15770 [Colwellia sp. MB3u-70]|uniref:hypothetical protein n=1 Tax=unclassified Colwellia TaxID=196834 RepID=UPI0015F59CFF|nr:MULTISPECIES: hypothetical protein [unclassified Colwellia]MBA6291925.1 hypothetical protein [Colwellia sp. MB3u-8]MBA6308569.1 hypothetical protein [Colwellia sp. MB3u-70]
MIKKFSLLALCSLSANAEVNVLANGTLETTACAYGRGSVAILEAKNQASIELANFIKGNKSLSAQATTQQISSSLTDDAATLYQKKRSLMLAGLNSMAMPLNYSSPILSGNDTCMKVSLDPNQLGASEEQNWQEDSHDISVTVIGEGWAKKGKSALVNAEQDALQRAVSQVVGVWLSQQYAQSSSTEMSIVDGNESMHMRELIGQQLSSHSEGLVKEWQTLKTKALQGAGMQVTLLAVVEKAPLVQQASQLLSIIGSPRVKVFAPEPLKTELKAWLNQQGIEVGDSASLAIYAQSELVKRENNRRLHLSIDVRDLSGNIYGNWKNDPSLMSLPKDPHVEQDLLAVYLASPSQSRALHLALNQAFTQVVARGGLVREILLPNQKLTEPEMLHDVLNTLGGVSDVAIHKRNDYTVASLRYKGNTGELANAVDQAIGTITSKTLSKIKIEDDFTLRYK